MFEPSIIYLVVQVLENEPPAVPHATFPISLLEEQQGSLKIPSFIDTEGDLITYTWVFENTTDDCNTKHG